MNNNKAVGWLKKIFSAQTLTVLGTVISLAIAYLAFVQDRSGTVILDWSQDQKLFSDAEGTVPEKLQYFCFYGSVAPDELNPTFLLPVVKNSSNRQVKGLSVSYEVHSSSCSLVLSDGYATRYSRINNAQTIDLESDNLPAFKDVEPPFSLLKVDSYPAYFKLKASISYDGIKAPLSLDYMLYNIHIPQDEAPTPERWRLACLKAAAANAAEGYDIYFYMNGKQADNNVIETLGPFSAEELDLLAALEVFPQKGDDK